MKSGVYVFIGLMIFVIIVAVLMVVYRSKNEDPKDNESVASEDTESVASEDTESVASEDTESVASEPEAESVASEPEQEAEPEPETEAEPDVSVSPVREPQQVIEDTVTVDKLTARMCVYTNQYERCDTKCGRGKRFRVQVPYDSNQNYDQTPHECVPDEDREFRPCTGIVCDETYTYPTFIRNNPGKDLDIDDYCEFIAENDACNDNYVMQNSLCSEQCPR
jgi:hypothetical protein